MKIQPRDAERFVRSPDPTVRAVLVYGPDGGLVRERAEALVRTAAEDPSDPFRVAELSGSDIKDDPARLRDEAAAMALTGGRRAVRLRGVDDGLAGLFKDFLAEPGGDALVVVEAGDLPPRSALRKAFESAGLGAALACYRDDGPGLSRLIETALRDRGLGIAPDALAYLAANLGGDRQLTRRELEKLALYKGTDGGRIELADAQACVGDSAALSLDDLAFAVGGGDLAQLERAFARSLQEGAQPVAALRAVARHFLRLHLVSGVAARGKPLDQAMKALRPPVFWKLARRFEDQARGWPAGHLARALARLLEAETDCKRTGAPAEALAARAMLDIAANAPIRFRRSAG